MCCLDTALGGKCFSGLACKNVSASVEVTVVDVVEETNDFKCNADGDCPFTY
jgi:hypothetical protein